MTAAALRWDVFCRVVDNFGDIGVCWRLCCQLAAHGAAVRLWVDDGAALAWMAPEGCAGVTVFSGPVPEAGYEAADVVIEAFGMSLPESVVLAIARAHGAQGRRVAWINLEYLSAEAYVARSHGLASPVHGGVAAGFRKWFFFPGFTDDTGGLLREAALEKRQASFDRAAWLARNTLYTPGEFVVTLFCYEPPALDRWLQALGAGAWSGTGHGGRNGGGNDSRNGRRNARRAGRRDGSRASGRPVRLLVTRGRASAAVQAAIARLPPQWNAGGIVRIEFLPFLSQRDFDHLLWAADCNFVRGEDSLVRAIWAGVPFVWQIYPQSDGAHRAKLAAFLGRLETEAPLPDGFRRFHDWWNGTDESAVAGDAPPWDWEAAKPFFAALRCRSLSAADLVTRLQRFVAENR